MTDKELFFHYLYLDNEYRIFNKKSLNKDLLQWDKNLLLAEEEKKLIDQCLKEENDFSINFIVGVPRSGTTLLPKVLISAFDLGTFYNKIAKYYSVPVYATNKLIKESISQDLKLSFDSNLGNSKGSYEPHEFGYFWQYYFKHRYCDELTNAEIDKINWRDLNKTLKAYVKLIGNDIVTKNVVYHNFQIRPMLERIDNSRCIHISRNPLFVIQSILESRNKQFGNTNIWWSIKPKYWKEWSSLSPIKQIVRQVLYTEFRIKHQLKNVSNDKKLHIQYEDLIRDTHEVMKKVEKFLDKEILLKRIDGLRDSNELRIDKETLSVIKYEIADFESNLELFNEF